MSLSNPKKKRFEAPPVLSQGDFFGLKNTIILIEYPEDQGIELLEGAIGNTDCLIVSPQEPSISKKNILFSPCSRISKASVYAKKVSGSLDLIIFDRVDMMNLDMDKKGWASQMKSYLSAFGNPNHLKGNNLIITSGRTEYLLREIADKFYNLK